MAAGGAPPYCRWEPTSLANDMQTCKMFESMNSRGIPLGRQGRKAHGGQSRHRSSTFSFQFPIWKRMRASCGGHFKRAIIWFCENVILKILKFIFIPQLVCNIKLLRTSNQGNKYLLHLIYYVFKSNFFMR